MLLRAMWKDTQCGLSDRLPEVLLYWQPSD